MLRVAVILTDTLHGTGLAALLERYFAPIEVEQFDRFSDLPQDGSGNYYDYYVTEPELYAARIDFFYPRRAQTALIVRHPGPADSAVPQILAMSTLEQLIERLEKFLTSAGDHPEAKSDELSAREIQVLQLVVSGAINKEIADKLNISLNTVLTHRKNITAKLGIKTISGLTLYALMHGYIAADDITL